jgi:hypothetical protein
MMAIWFQVLALGVIAVVVGGGSIPSKSPAAEKEQRLKLKKEAAEAEKKELEREAEEKKAAQEEHFERELARLMGKTQPNSQPTVSIEKDLAAFRTKKIKTTEEKVSESIHKDLQEAQKFETESKAKMSQEDKALMIAKQRLSHAEAQSRIVDAHAKENNKVKFARVKQPEYVHSQLPADMTPAEASAALKERKSEEETEKAYHYLKNRVKA